MVERSVMRGLAGILLLATPAMAQAPLPQDFRPPAPQNVVPYVPADSRGAGGPAQAFSPQDFRATARPYGQAAPAMPQDYRAAAQPPQFQPPVMPQGAAYQPPVAQPPIYQPPVLSEPRPAQALPRDPRYADPRASVQDYRNRPAVRAAEPPAQPLPAARINTPYEPRPAQPYARPLPAEPQYGMGGMSGYGMAAPQAVEGRYPVYESRPGVIDPRVVQPRREEYIDYKAAEGRSYDFRPLDYKPVDTRVVDYKSEDNRVPDQKVLDPRLKEKGPEIAQVLECKAILYRAVECNFIDYKEVDPKLQELLNRYPEVTFGIVPKEYNKEAMDRWQPLLTHLSREIGLKISLKVANDYRALIESQRAGVIHMALYNPLSFARARASGVKLDAFAVETGTDGSKAGHSVVYALARSPVQRLEDLRGRSIGYVDPNSVSGYFVPKFVLAAQKIDSDATPSRQVFTGSHENALTALSQGLIDAAVGQWTSEEDSTLAKMLARGALKHPDGTPMRREDFKVLYKSEPVMNAPIAYLSDLPEDLKALIRRAMLEAPMRDRAAFEGIYKEKGRTWEVVDNKAYDNAIDLVRFMDDARTRPQAAANPARPQQQAAR